MTLVQDEAVRFAIEQIERKDATQRIGYVLGELEKRITAIEKDLWKMQHDKR